MKKNKVFRAIPELCTGCWQCQLVCSLTKTGTINPSRARIRVSRSEKDGSCAPIVCRHCKAPLCQLACPAPEAMYLDEDTGAVVINDAKCIGCLACMEACPFDAIWIGPDKEVLKCDLCGGDPMCAKVCRHYPHLPNNALSFQ